ncbi:unnamed protein product [Laminaria digitata]
MARGQASIETGLPPVLAAPLRAEEGEVTALQNSIWSEGRAGADLLIEAASGHETTVAFAAFLLERVLDALASAELAKPRRYYFRGSGSGRKGLENPGKAAGSGASSGSDGLKTAKLQSIVLTKNRDIAAGVTVSSL